MLLSKDHSQYQNFSMFSFCHCCHHAWPGECVQCVWCNCTSGQNQSLKKNSFNLKCLVSWSVCWSAVSLFEGEGQWEDWIHISHSDWGPNKGGSQKYVFQDIVYKSLALCCMVGYAAPIPHHSVLYGLVKLVCSSPYLTAFLFSEWTPSCCQESKRILVSSSTSCAAHCCTIFLCHLDDKHRNPNYNTRIRN